MSTEQFMMQSMPTTTTICNIRDCPEVAVLQSVSSPTKTFLCAKCYDHMHSFLIQSYEHWKCISPTYQIQDGSFPYFHNWHLIGTVWEDQTAVKVKKAARMSVRRRRVRMKRRVPCESYARTELKRVVMRAANRKYWGLPVYE